jgi:DNA-directed RNA polymerase subunit RPC12/RpoP
MTRPLRICLDCIARHYETGPRCRTCYLNHQKARNAARPQYTGTWRTTSRHARRAIRQCARCGQRTDLTLDHETGQVECRHCNSSHRRNPSR